MVGGRETGWHLDPPGEGNLGPPSREYVFELLERWSDTASASRLYGGRQGWCCDSTEDTSGIEAGRLPERLQVSGRCMTGGMQHQVTGQGAGGKRGPWCWVARSFEETAVGVTWGAWTEGLRGRGLQRSGAPRTSYGMDLGLALEKSRGWQERSMS